MRALGLIAALFVMTGCGTLALCSLGEVLGGPPGRGFMQMFLMTGGITLLALFWFKSLLKPPE